MEPRSIHAWRQSDCISFALNFYHNRTNFLEPGVSNLGKTGDGKIASDFPLIQYGVAQIWKVTGVNITIFRLIDLMFLTLGLFYCFKIFVYWFNENYLLALLITGILYTSTILVYYGPTTISDIQAFGLSCMAFYYFITWLDKKQFSYLIGAVFVFLFAGLFKMSSAFIYAIALAYFLVRIIFGERESKYALLSFKTIVFLAIPFIGWFAWYYHVHLYNELHDNDFFLIGILPIWSLEQNEILRIGGLFFKNTLPAILNIYLLFFLATLTSAWLVLNVRQFLKERYLRLLIPVLVFTSYVLLFFEVFSIHDYYFINMIPVFVILLGLLVQEALENFPRVFSTSYLYMFLFLILVALTYQETVVTNARIGFINSEEPSSWLTKEESDYYSWNNWYDRSRYDVLETISENTLDSIGITKEKQVMCLGDISINRGLCLIDRLGYSTFNTNIENSASFIEDKKHSGLEYLILIEPDWLNNEKLQPYLKNKIYEKKGTSIYKL